MTLSDGVSGAHFHGRAVEDLCPLCQEPRGSHRLTLRRGGVMDDAQCEAGQYNDRKHEPNLWGQKLIVLTKPGNGKSGTQTAQSIMSALADK